MHYVIFSPLGKVLVNCEISSESNDEMAVVPPFQSHYLGIVISALSQFSIHNNNSASNVDSIDGPLQQQPPSPTSLLSAVITLEIGAYQIFVHDGSREKESQILISDDQEGDQIVGYFSAVVRLKNSGEDEEVEFEKAVRLVSICFWWTLVE